MKKSPIKTIVITIISIFLGIYIIFLLLPFILNPIINGYTTEVKNIIKETTGLKSELKNIKLITTPKLTAGIKIEQFKLSEPNNTEVFNAQNFQAKMSLIPLLAKKIEMDLVQLEDVKLNIFLDRNGNLAILKYFPQPEENITQTEVQNVNTTQLPFGIKLSNHLPNIKIGNYNITITDGNEKYVLAGNNTEIYDFILNKSIKFKGIGNITLKGREQFSYDIKIVNRIMPNIELNDLVLNQTPQEEAPKEEFKIPNIIEIFRGIYTNNLTGRVKADLVINKDDIDGVIDLTNLSMINLPNSSAKINFNGNKINLLSNIYTAKNEVSKIQGIIKTGKHPDINLKLQSKVELSNIVQIIKELALIFNIQDLQTLSANGKLDANFDIKSNLKTIKSSGYINIPSADLYYGLYKIGIDKINTEIKLDNNNVNIKNLGFTIFNQPLRIYGTISNDAVSDLHINANNLSLRGLVVALGQAHLLKENPIQSGLITLNGSILGKLNKLTPSIKIALNNINVKNMPSKTTLLLPATIIGITSSDGKSFNGNIKGSEIEIINPCARISIPNVSAKLNEKDIEIFNTPVYIDNISINVIGKIKNYMTEKINLDFVTSGDIKSKLIGDLNVVKQNLNLNYSTTDLSTIVIPMFNRSKMSFTGNINILGNMLNPTLKGSINIPTINIPEIPISMDNLVLNLNGPILRGKGSVAKFTSGGIVAENLTSDFSLRGSEFYLNNLQGTAFDGNINGDIIYNLNNAKTNVKFSGNNMNATKAIAGAAGIKNALSGTLGFDANLSLKVADYNEMMKSLKGNVKFDVKNGAFGTIGRFDRLLQANNIMTNTILKTTVSTLINSVSLTDTLKFTYLDGNLDFNNGWADIKPIKSSGKSLAYYVTGKYNLVNGTTNINILGRLDSFIISKLGLLGEITADKILAYIPKLGPATTRIVHNLTTTPKDENTSALPELTSGRKNYKDFKVVYNGGIGSTSSVKSFKWIANVDTSAIEGKDITTTVKDLKTSVSTDYQNTVNTVKDIVTTSKESWDATRNDLKELKNLFKRPATPTTPVESVN